MEKDCVPLFYSWETEAMSTLWCAEQSWEGIKYVRDLASALLSGSSVALWVKGVYDVHLCFKSTPPVWMWPWFTPRICQDHKNRGLVHSWDAVCIRELWSQVQFWPWIVSGSNETGSETGLSRHSDLPCAVTGWRYPETQSTLISLVEATQWLSQYLKPQMSGCHPYTKH